MFRTLIRIASLLLVAPVVFGALAGEGRTPIYKFPTTITSPGNYILTRNLVGPPAGPGTPMIDILASDVDIDLNGFAMEYQGGTEIAVQAINQKSIAIRNGSILNGYIHVVDCKKVVVEDLRINDPGDRAIDFDNVTNYAIRRNHIVRAVTEGIRIDSSSGTLNQGSIEGNHVEDCGSGIVVIFGGSVGILNNRVDRVNGSAVGAVGVTLDQSRGCLLSENTVYSSAGDGIALSSCFCCKLFDNIVHDVSFNGIILTMTDDSLLLNNVISEANQDGIFIDGKRNHIDRNPSSSNFQFGLHFGPAAADNTYGRNTARGNVGGPCPTGGTPDFCDEGVNDSSFGDNFLPTLM